MATSTSSAAEVSTESSLSTVTAVGCVLATLGSIVYISLNGLEPREAYAHPLSIVSGAVTTIGIMLLSLALMRSRTTLPGWAVASSAAGLWVAGATAWSSSTVMVAVAVKTDNGLFEKILFNSPWLFVQMGPKSLLCLVGFLALAISGWRNQSISRPAAAALGVAGVLSIWPPYPPGLILASLALFLIARAGMAPRT
jgi:hypothetical protein